MFTQAQHREARTTSTTSSTSCACDIMQGTARSPIQHRYVIMQAFITSTTTFPTCDVFDSCTTDRSHVPSFSLV